MKNFLGSFLFIVSLSLLALLLTSCNFPLFPTTPPDAEPIEDPQETPTQECSVVGNVNYLPTIGSKLKWVDASDFVYVPEGEFVMGAASEEPEDFNPQHIVFLDDFWIQETEVTNQQYARCVDAGVCAPPFEEDNELYRFPDTTYANYPVVGVDWSQAEDYCTWIEARLPSEAEWEKAVRGPEGYKYPWGTEEPSCDLLNFNDCLDPSEPANVLSYENGQSFFKAMELSGNVFEWVADWYQEDYYLISPVVNPTGPAEGLKRVFRGGSYTTTPEDILAWMRFNLEPEKHSEEIGFRCALDGPEIECNTITNSNVSVHPPPCQVPAINNSQPENQPTFTPIPPCDPPDISTSCQWVGGSQISGITISIGNCYDNILETITGNGADLNCYETGSDPHRYVCDAPPGSAQGSAIELKTCYQEPPKQVNPVCPAGYEYNSISSFCEPSGPWLPEPPCPVGYMDDEFFGCLPDPFFGDCPAGFVELPGGCLPLDLCLWPVFSPCETPVCSAGEVYEPENDCCVIPEKLKAVCPAGFVYDEGCNYCGLPDSPDNCFIATINLTYCPTPTPTIPPPDRCLQYTNRLDCLANNCRVILSDAGGFDRCVSP